ncbi:hypothetical protein [Candidatus Reidiella endopervernicosa]|nr:hypothetical protein [Candidatus Reidiella endopervernicosa]
MKTIVLILTTLLLPSLTYAHCPDTLNADQYTECITIEGWSNL